MQYKIRSNPLFSACGLNCGLCPRYHTDGPSKCPGCAGQGFLAKHPSCGILTCCQSKGIEYCFLCGEYPCKKYHGADLSDSFITHKNQLKDFVKVKEIGLESYEAESNRKVDILEHLLKHYDDGRRKSFYCTAVNLLELKDLTSAMEQIEIEAEPADPQKEKAKLAARLIKAMAEKRGISLKLRKKEG